MSKIKGSLVHIAPAYAGSGKGYNHFGSYVPCLYMHFYKRLFSGLDLMVTRQQLTAVQGLPFTELAQ
jgi:hypothetical protein